MDIIKFFRANLFNDHSINTVTEKIVDYETLGIKEYEYPSEFYMGDNLKTAITQLALSYENFNKDSIRYGFLINSTVISRFCMESIPSYPTSKLAVITTPIFVFL